GCCFSRDADSSPYPGSTAGQHGDSSRQINPDPEPILNRASSHSPSRASTATSQPSRAARRALPLSEHFNQPIRQHVWKSKRRIWTRATIDRERLAFFDTRVAGRREIWAALATALTLLREGDVSTAQGIIDAAGVTVPTGDICEGCYDEGYKCDTGADLEADDEMSTAKMVLSADSCDELLDKEKEKRREEKGKRNERDYVRVTARLSDRGGPDVVVSIGKEQTVGALVRKIQAEAGLSDSRIQLVYLGKICKESQTLLAQGWKEGHVLNAYVRGPK
ncbi:hypothetical protein FQN49_006084, partial [Arthroderma sp. PD_2]